MFHKFTIGPGNSRETLIIKGKCIKTGKPVEMEISAAGYNNYYHGQMSVQTAFPELTRDQREYLVSGLSAEGWNLLFPPEEEDGTDDDSCL